MQAYQFAMLISTISSILVCFILVAILTYKKYVSRSSDTQWLLQHRSIRNYCIVACAGTLWSTLQYTRLSAILPCEAYLYLCTLCMHTLLVVYITYAQHITWVCAFNTYAYVVFNYRYDRAQFVTERAVRRSVRYDAENSNGVRESHLSHTGVNKIQPYSSSDQAKYINNYTVRHSGTSVEVGDEVLANVVVEMSQGRDNVSIKLLDIIPNFAVRHAAWNRPRTHLVAAVIYMMFVLALVAIVDSTTLGEYDLGIVQCGLRTEPALQAMYGTAVCMAALSIGCLGMFYKTHVNDIFYIRDEVLCAAVLSTLGLVVHIVTEIVNVDSVMSIHYTDNVSVGAVLTTLLPAFIAPATGVFVMLSSRNDRLGNTATHKYQSNIDLRQILRSRALTTAWHIYLRRCLYMRQYKLYFQLTQWYVKYRRLVKPTPATQVHIVLNDGRETPLRKQFDSANHDEYTAQLADEYQKRCVSLLQDARVIYTDYFTPNAWLKLDGLHAASRALVRPCCSGSDDNAEQRTQEIAAIVQPLRDHINDMLRTVFVPHFARSALYRTVKRNDVSSSHTSAGTHEYADNAALPVSGPQLTADNIQTQPALIQPIQPIVQLPPMMSAIEADARLHNQHKAIKHRVTAQRTPLKLPATGLRKEATVRHMVAEHIDNQMRMSYDSDTSISIQMPNQHISLNSTPGDSIMRAASHSYDSLNGYMHADKVDGTLLPLHRDLSSEPVQSALTRSASTAGDTITRRTSIVVTPATLPDAPLIGQHATSQPMVQSHEQASSTLHTAAAAPTAVSQLRVGRAMSDDAVTNVPARRAAMPLRLPLQPVAQPTVLLGLPPRQQSTRYQPSSRAISSYVHVKHSSYESIAAMIQAQQAASLQHQIQQQTHLPVTLSAKTAVSVQPPIFNVLDVQQSMQEHFSTLDRSRSPSRLAVR